MATSAGSAGTPIRPVSGESGSGSVVLETLICTASTAFSPGDIVIASSSGRATVDTTDPVAEIMGVAMCKKAFTSAATIDDDGSTIPDSAGDIHALSIALALPGQRFVGTMFEFTGGTTPNNHTGAIADLHDAYALAQTTQGIMGIDFLDTAAGTAAAFVIAWASPAMDGVTPGNPVEFGRNPTVVNPRAQFYFIVARTVFGLA